MTQYIIIWELIFLLFHFVQTLENTHDSGAEDNDVQETGINTDVESEECIEEEEVPQRSQKIKDKIFMRT